MKAGSDPLIIFLTASVFLITLFVVLMFLPRLLRKKESEEKSIETDTVMGAFHALGTEIKSLKDQLVLKERLAALGEVSAGIAHEIRNPMGVIAGYAKLLLRSFDEHDDRRALIQNILKEIEEMNLIMEELLKFSKSEPVRKVDVNIADTVRQVVQSMGEAAQRITFSCSNNIIIKGDETLLRQALKNLLHNALDAGEKVWITIEEGKTSGKNGVFIAVRDNGRGIPEENLDKIFMPFYTTKEVGSGIGLALVQKIVMGHGGSISVESGEGKGATFRLFLPGE